MSFEGASSKVNALGFSVRNWYSTDSGWAELMRNSMKLRRGRRYLVHMDRICSLDWNTLQVGHIWFSCGKNRALRRLLCLARVDLFFFSYIMITRRVIQLGSDGGVFWAVHTDLPTGGLALLSSINTIYG
jgi:hypothetical protein